MIFYTKKDLNNLLLLQQAEKATEEGYLNKDQLKAIKQNQEAPIYSPNLFIRIGLFFLTNTAAFFTMGSLAAMILSSLTEDQFHVLGYFMGLLSFTALEFLLRSKKYYRSGVDDGLSWMGCSFLGMGISPLFQTQPIVFFSILLPLIFLASIRYLNEVLAAAAVVCLFVLIYYVAAEKGGIVMDVLPFIYLFVAGLVVYLIEKFRYQQQFRHWYYWHRAAHAISLLLVYFSINYYVVREASIQLLHKKLQPDQQIPLGGFFWLFTFLIPLFFLASGLRKKQPIKYRIGLLTLILSFLTLRNYYHLMALEMILTLAGAGMLVLGYVLIRYFKENRHGYSYHPMAASQADALANLEALVIGEGMGGGQESTSGKSFGGGSSGGAGASGQY